MITYIKPIIEYYKTTGLMSDYRKSIAGTICRYLRSGTKFDNQKIYKPEFYSAIEELLRSPYYCRILLYLPFCILPNAPISFRETYMSVWQYMLGTRDARENFHEGDVFELDARPNGELEYVVKCAHLTPWLLKAGYLNAQGLWKILCDFQEDEILLRSFSETWRYILDENILPQRSIDLLSCATNQIPKRVKPQPLYVSKERFKWLEEIKNNFPKKLVTPKAHLEGPFSPNISLDDIPHLEKGEVAFIGGSRLKGYGVEESDLDIYKFSELFRDYRTQPGSPHAAHIYFNCVYASSSGNEEFLKSLASSIMNFYSRDGSNKAQSIERLEIDLLQYRLLHKGFQRFTGKTKFATSNYIEIDGDCPFYDDEYRKIATMLYAKYVYIP